MNALTPRTLIIGDVHGCLRELEELLAKAKYQQGRDQLIFVGDLVNKGPYSLGVLKKVQELRAKVVLGNNEQSFLQYVADGSFEAPGFQQLKEEMGEQLSYWVDWIKQWPFYLEFPDFMVVHAGLVPGRHPSCTSSRILTTIRTWDGLGENLNHLEHPPWFELYTDKKLVLFGHWAKKNLVIRHNAIGLDTGCVYGRSLTAVILPSRKIVQVSAHQMYEIPLLDTNS